MTQIEKYNQIANAFKIHGEKEIYVFSDQVNDEVKEVIQDIMYDNIRNFDLSYEVAGKACEYIASIPFEELQKVDIQEAEHASVYIATRLSYLNLNNQYDITEVLKECGCDIQEACAIWFDRAVQVIAENLIAYIYQ